MGKGVSNLLRGEQGCWTKLWCADMADVPADVPESTLIQLISCSLLDLVLLLVLSMLFWISPMVSTVLGNGINNPLRGRVRGEQGCWFP